MPHPHFFRTLSGAESAIVGILLTTILLLIGLSFVLYRKFSHIRVRHICWTWIRGGRNLPQISGYPPTRPDFLQLCQLGNSEQQTFPRNEGIVEPFYLDLETDPSKSYWPFTRSDAASSWGSEFSNDVETNM